MERRSPWECDALPKLKDERIALHLSKEQILDREQSTAGRAIRRHRARRESIGCKADLAPSGYLKIVERFFAWIGSNRRLGALFVGIELRGLEASTRRDAESSGRRVEASTRRAD